MPEVSETVKLEELDFYSFFTKYSLMEEYGFSSGLIDRIFRKILPPVPDPHTAEYVLLNEKEPVSTLLARMDFEGLAQSSISQQLDLSIQALCSKLLAFGLDNNIKSKYNFLNLDSKPFEELLEKSNALADFDREETEAVIEALDGVERLVMDLRRNKSKIGTSFHLTLTTRKILEYIRRIKELIDLKLNIDSKEHWEKLFLEYIPFAKRKNSIRRHIRRHTDLIALEIVEHTADKGEKYIAENRKEYWSFFSKALIGGSIIALFAFVKLFISSFPLSQWNDALFFSINYALCFIVVKECGGIIATKQPAMTASTIAENIDRESKLKIDSIQSIATLVRKVFRSQFISILGNFLMAFTFACLIMFVLQLLDAQKLIGVVKPGYLIKNVLPSGQLVAFAAVAGCYLALSGLIAGYVDNKVVESRVAYRIRHSRLFFKSKKLGYLVEKKAGGLIGNIFLGFFLGSTFLLNNILPFPIDIRHIAFSSSYVGYSVVKESLDPEIIAWALAGALLIGFVNFIVSFSITLYLALKSRGVSLSLIPNIIFNIAKDFIRHPLYYFFEMEAKAEKENHAL